MGRRGARRRGAAHPEGVVADPRRARTRLRCPAALARSAAVLRTGRRALLRGGALRCGRPLRGGLRRLRTGRWSRTLGDGRTVSGRRTFRCRRPLGRALRRSGTRGGSGTLRCGRPLRGGLGRFRTGRRGARAFRRRTRAGGRSRAGLGDRTASRAGRSGGTAALVASGGCAAVAGALAPVGREGVAQLARDRSLHRRGGRLHVLAQVSELTENFFAGDTELLSELVHAGLACHCSPY
jgi:hypothetical protein